MWQLKDYSRNDIPGGGISGVIELEADQGLKRSIWEQDRFLEREFLLSAHTYTAYTSGNTAQTLLMEMCLQKNWIVWPYILTQQLRVHCLSGSNYAPFSLETDLITFTYSLRFMQ